MGTGPQAQKILRHWLTTILAKAAIHIELLVQIIPQRWFQGNFTETFMFGSPWSPAEYPLNSLLKGRMIIEEDEMDSA